MRESNRREFLADVGRGMLIASLGPAVAGDLGLASAAAADAPAALNFGKLEPLVALMQDTPAEKLLPVLVEKIRAGTDLRTLTAAGALANCRAFGGQDYTGYHAFMALTPAFQMSSELPENMRALPVLKVLYRNTSRMQVQGGRKKEVLHAVEPATLPAGDGSEALRETTRRDDFLAAERAFATLAKGPAGEAFNHVQYCIQDEIDVHRVVLSWRAWTMLDLTGPEQAHTLLRQSVRYCVDTSRHQIQNKRPPSPVRTVLPKLLDQYRLVGKPLGTRRAEDGWIEKLSHTIYGEGRDRAADAVAAALAEGMSPEDVGEAISLAANRLVLCDPGRRQSGGDNKPKGSVHGDSVGVHASDAANAWRNIARVSNARNAVASLIIGAYHTAGQHSGQNPQPFPLAEHREKVQATDAGQLLKRLEAAVKEQDQTAVCALVSRYGEQGHAPRSIFDLLLRFAVSEDGALHAEKYYRTVTEEFAGGRPAFQWRHLIALARVTASECGQPAPGHAEACRLLKV